MKGYSRESQRDREGRQTMQAGKGMDAGYTALAADEKMRGGDAVAGRNIEAPPYFGGCFFCCPGAPFGRCGRAIPQVLCTNEGIGGTYCKNCKYPRSGGELPLIKA